MTKEKNKKVILGGVLGVVVVAALAWSLMSPTSEPPAGGQTAGSEVVQTEDDSAEVVTRSGARPASSRSRLAASPDEPNDQEVAEDSEIKSKSKKKPKKRRTRKKRATEEEPEPNKKAGKQEKWFGK